MASQTFSILRQGVWASLTGGWYYDPRQSHFSNVFHLYAWLLLLCLPLSIQVLIKNRFENETEKLLRFSTSSFVLWIAYCIVIGVIFLVIKLVNVYLHNLFDAGECIVEEADGDQDSGTRNDSDDIDALPDLERTSDSTTRRRSHNSGRRTIVEAIEMVVMNESSGPPVVEEEDEEDEDKNTEKDFENVTLAGVVGALPDSVEMHGNGEKEEHEAIKVDSSSFKAQDAGENQKEPTKAEEKGPFDVYATNLTGGKWSSSSSSSTSPVLSLEAPAYLVTSTPVNRTNQVSSRSLSASREGKAHSKQSNSVFSNNRGLEKESSAPLLGATSSNYHEPSTLNSIGDAAKGVPFDVYPSTKLAENKWRPSSSSSSTSSSGSEGLSLNTLSASIQPQASTSHQNQKLSRSFSANRRELNKRGGGGGDGNSYTGNMSTGKKSSTRTSGVSVNFDPTARIINPDDTDLKVPFDVYPTNLGDGKWNTSSSSSSTSEVISLNTPANILHTPMPCHRITALKSRSPSASTSYGGVTSENLSNHNIARLIASYETDRPFEGLADDNSFMFQDMLASFSPNRPPRRLDLQPNVILSHHQASLPSTYNNNIPDLTFSALRFSDFTSPDLPPPRPKQFFKLWLPPYLNWIYVKVRFDRLQLLALLDKNLTTSELVISILLALLVGILGSIIMQLEIFQDIFMFLFCFVVASCQYTLLKSVQPDAASPTHGYNRTIIYSRPLYFSFGCATILICYYLQLNRNEGDSSSKITVYGINICNPAIVDIVMEGAKIFILSFPLIFSFGLLPQINTFFMYLFEQMDIHIFGGTAATMGLSSAVYSISRSIVVIAILYGLAILSLWRVYHTPSPRMTDFSVYDYDVLFSIYMGILVSLTYHLSRCSSDMTVLWSLVTKCLSFKRKVKNQSGKNSRGVSSNKEAGNGEEIEMKVQSAETESSEESDDHDVPEYVDPLPKKLERTVTIRLQNDLIICVLITIVVFAIHVSSIFRLQPVVEITLRSIAVGWGFVLHYLLKHSRKELPWLCFAQPILKPKEYDLFEVKGIATLMWFEYLHAWLWLIEKNVVYPLVFISAITTDAPQILDKFGFYAGTLIVVICGFKCIRSSLNDSSFNYLILVFTYLFFEFDLQHLREAFLINYFFGAIVFSKCYELMLKMKFVLTYVAPWQITWGSAFHAFAQPFSVPHSAMLFVQAGISAVLSSPLQPVLGSAIFLSSYVRPIKFWERDYNTKRVDHSNTRLASQLDRSQLGTDDNNLNSIFYEHLTRSLQTSLYGDLALGRWGQVSQGDCYVLASDNLNCLVHIIELGNGMVTFQLRGLEFRGTYCQQREVEALSEGVSEDEGCCCCEPGHLPNMLSINAAFNQRWLAWEVTHTKYVLEGYSITDNSALTMLQQYEMRKALIVYYVKAVIFYTITNGRLEKWLGNELIKEALEPLTKDNFVDLDPTFNLSIDEDYDFRAAGITMQSFYCVYFNWIKYCLEEHCNRSRLKICSSERESDVVTLCFALSLLARRALSVASHHNSFSSVEFLLYGLHALFKGDFRITSPRDEWVFQDIELLKQVIAPAVRMAVKLHQDHFMSTDEYDDNSVLYSAIVNYHENIVISHEADPRWRNAVLSNVDSLLALRHVFDDGTDQYKIIMLNKRYLSFRLIKVNRECVRGLWAGQQQELVYLRNRNPERGSIQNAKQALRNIINSSCDQPIGYPIYVSPLTTSFADTSTQLCKVIGHPFSFGMFKTAALRFWTRVKVRCGEVSSGGPVLDEDTLGKPVSMATCRRHRHDMYMFERNLGVRGSRESHSSDRSSEIESSLLLHRRQRGHSSHSASVLGNPHSYGRKVPPSSARFQHSSSSTLVNLSAFRSFPTGSRGVPLPTTLDVEMASSASSFRTNQATTSAAQVPSSQAQSTTVSASTVDLSTGSFGTTVHKTRGDLV